MKCKVGDKARVRSDLVLYGKTYGGLSFTTAMSEFKGKTVTIKLVLGNKYRLVEDTDEFAWSDEMLEDVEEEFKLPEKWCIKQCSGLMDWGKTTLNRPDKEFDSDKSYYWPVDESLVNWDFGGKRGREDITFDQFKKYVLKSEPTPVKEEVKFEVGKWYKNPRWWSSPQDFCKFSGEARGDLIGYTDKIIKGVPYFGSTGYWCNGDSCAEASAEEIQQYLPENHPDKIKRKTKKVEDLRYPDVVHCSSKEERDLLSKHVSHEVNGWNKDYPYLLIEGGSKSSPYKESDYGYVNYEFYDIIFPEEKVETKPMLSKEELLAEAKRRYPVGTKYKCASNDSSDIFVLSSDDWSNSLLDDVVHAESRKGCLYYKGDWAEIISEPTVEEHSKYVECIELDEIDTMFRSHNFTVGEIYLVEEDDETTSFRINGVWCYKSQFKTSTKEAFDKQGKSGIKEKEELVQTGMSQQEACRSCSYYKIVKGASKRCYKQDSCDATGGQHYPKDNLSKKYVVGIDPSDAESSSEGIEVGKFPLDRGIGIYKEMARLHMQAYYPMGPINDIYKTPAEPKDCFGSDEIYVPIIKTEVKQIKL